MKISVIITAGGTSSRYSKTKNKLLEIIQGKTIIEYSVEVFLQTLIDEIIISANPSIIPDLKKIFKSKSNIKIIEGGKTRQESVYNGLKIATCDYVLIHDGARPMVSEELVKNIVNEVIVKKALTTVTKTTDTIKEVDKSGKILKTVPRESLYNTQTPQAFEYNLILRAHEKLIGQNFTDDAGMLEFLGENVYIFEGDYKNIKITTPIDIELAKTFFKCK